MTPRLLAIGLYGTLRSIWNAANPPRAKCSCECKATLSDEAIAELRRIANEEMRKQVALAGRQGPILQEFDMGGST